MILIVMVVFSKAHNTSCMFNVLHIITGGGFKEIFKVVGHILGGEFDSRNENLQTY